MQRGRKVHVKGEEWRYLIGKSNVVIWSPDKKKYVPRLHEVAGGSNGRYSSFDDDYATGTFNPSVIKDYIEIRILDIEPSVKMRCENVLVQYTIDPALDLETTLEKIKEHSEKNRCKNILKTYASRRWKLCESCFKK
jgi:hypothetical protein